MIVSVCSFGSSGSSAVSDYLREFPEIHVFDKVEFTWVSEVDGLIDLERDILVPYNRTNSSIIGIDRYLKSVKRKLPYYRKLGFDTDLISRSAEEFVESISQAKWQWYISSEVKRGFLNKVRNWFLYKWMYVIIPRIEKKRGHQISCWPMRTVYLSAAPENYFPAAKKHMCDVLTAIGIPGEGITVLDQAFSGVNPQACFPYYDDPCAIVVDRDPRDMYVFSQTKLLGHNHFMACDTVENYIRYYRALRDRQAYRQENDRVLRVQFEDMVYDYERTTKTIREFLKLGENEHQKTVFDPSLSIANTQVFKRFPQYAEAVKLIEKELPEYLYDFDKFGEVEITGEMFFGKSPLNRN